jgi:ATP-binding cassette subfamily C protein
VRARGGIAVVVAHRPSAIAGTDYILVMAKGRQQQFGPKRETSTAPSNRHRRRGL